MAAYAATVSLSHVVPIKMGNTQNRIVHGTIDVTNYNSTLAAITALTGLFKNGAPTVVLGGVSSNGFLVAWIPASKSIKAWYPNPAHAHTLLIKGNQTFTGALGYVRTGTVMGLTAVTDLSVTGDATMGGVQTNTAAGGSEVANDVAVGSVPFMAFGI